ncbi:hypothetical protein AKO1_006899 [Acrasis kona]|uniref:Uncharacterized protein n=1 Tax=Acrasis kona TaxID=1008807 RepID=A0AAW2YUK4_9EUKA
MVYIGFQVGIKAKSGRYICAEPNDNVTINRDKLGQWGTFTIVSAEGKKPGARVKCGDVVQFKSHFGKWLCAEPSGTIIANRQEPSAWETFTIVDGHNNDNYYGPIEGEIMAIRTNHGTYVSDYEGSATATKNMIKEGEQFYFVVVTEPPPEEFSCCVVL